MQINFSNSVHADRMTDEALIDYLFSEDIVDLFYEDDVIGNFNDGIIDFGGGIKGITCRSVLAACNKNTKNLCKILKIKLNNTNKQLCGVIIEKCKEQISSAAYLL